MLSMVTSNQRTTITSNGDGVGSNGTGGSFMSSPPDIAGSGQGGVTKTGSAMSGNSSDHNNKRETDAGTSMFMTMAVEDQFLLSPNAIIPKASTNVSDSTRSWKSFISEGSREATGSIFSRPTSVHSNLMRARKQKDPKRYYQVVEVLGEGSMGSVAKVRKRQEAIGGSARSEYVKKEKGCCFVLFSALNLPSLMPKFDQLAPLNSSSGVSAASSSNEPFPPGGAKHDSRHGATGRNSRHGAGAELQTMSQHSTDYSAKRGNSSKYNAKTPIKHTSSMISYTKRLSDGSGANKVCGTYYALKSIHLDRCTTPEYVKELRNEVEILKQLDHPNIVRAVETFDWHDRLYLLLEICSGGDLYTRDPYTEEQAARIVRSLLSAVAYLHDHDIIHRDLKFENIMFSDTRPEADIKLIDFGLSQKFARNEHLRDAVGTVYTMAPELLAGDYNTKADIWSIGVISFMLLSSSLPFYGKDRVHVIKKIISGKFSYSSRRWKRISPEAKKFVRDLLEQDPESRPDAKHAQQLAWLDEETTENDDAANDAMDRIQANIAAFAGYSKLKKLALMVIAYKSTPDEIGNLKKMFQKFDDDRNGSITLEEFKHTLSQHYEYTEEELETMFNGIDVDGTGTVHYCEFLAATMESQGPIDEERIAEAFDRIDSDDTGYITVSNLRDFLGDDLPTDYLDDIIEEADLKGDHRISYEEFLELWNGETDSLLAMSNVKVKQKRIGSRQNSFDSEFDSSRGISASVVSSLSGDELTDSERSGVPGTPRRAVTRDPGKGSRAFMKQKREVSLRGLL